MRQSQFNFTMPTTKTMIPSITVVHWLIDSNNNRDRHIFFLDITSAKPYHPPFSFDFLKLATTTANFLLFVVVALVMFRIGIVSG